MKRGSLLLLACVIELAAGLAPCAVAIAREPLSASRAPGWPSGVRARNQVEESHDFWPELPSDFPGVTAFDSRVTRAELDPGALPEVEDPAALLEMFRRIRDARDWRWEAMAEFPRRLTWLFPADGCFLRASYMIEKFREWGAVVPKQLFAFGNLGYSGPFGEASWWYHVAPAVRHAGGIVVIDPSVDFERPLPIEIWMSRISADRDPDAGFSVCESAVVSPDDECRALGSLWEPEHRTALLQDYLAQEWGGLEEFIGSSPERLLGDHPPWTSTR